MRAHLTIALVLVAASTARADLSINGNFEAGNTGFSTDYTFANQSMTPGTYTVAANPHNFNSNLESFGDHTSGTGLMEIVDGLGSSSRAWDESVTVIPDTDYTFSVWLRPSDQFNLPQIALSAGSLGTSKTLTLVDGEWDQLSFTFNTGSASAAILSIADVNPQPLALGNDFVLDDVALASRHASPEPATVTLFSVSSWFFLARHRNRRSKPMA